MTFRGTRTSAAIMTATALMTAVSACSGINTTADGQNATTTRTSTGPTHSTVTAPASTLNTTSSTSPSSTVPTYLRDYSRKQRKAYRQALAAYKHYNAVYTKVFHSGKATKEAKKALQRVALEAVWISDWYNLQQMEKHHAHVNGNVRVLWAHPTRVKLSTKEGGSVTLRACISSKGTEVVNQHGGTIPVEKKGHKDPGLARVIVDRSAGAPWKLARVTGGKKSCHR